MLQGLAALAVKLYVTCLCKQRDAKTANVLTNQQQMT